MNCVESEKDYATVFPFWEELSDSEKQKLCRFTQKKSFSRGELIHGAKDECTGAIVVMSGCIRVFMLSDEGREITLYRLNPGDICMLSASCVLKSITFEVMVEADSPCECLMLNGKAFAEIAEKNIRVKNFALEIAVARFSSVMWVMQQILFMSFDRRLAIFLLDELAEGSDTIRMTNEQIAKYMGSAREVVSRMLKYFSSEQIAERTKEGVKIINIEKLRALTR